MDNKKVRRQHSPAFKVQVVSKWKQQALGFVENSFNGQSFTQQLRQKDEFIEELYKQIGKLKYEVDWLKKKMGIAGL